MKKIGVIADTHILSGPVRLPAEVTSEFEGADLILHAGDMVRSGVIEELELIAPVKAVCGNCDAALDERTAPVKRIVRVEGVRIGLIHSLGRSPDSYHKNAVEEFGDRVDCVVFGHSHKPYSEWRGGLFLFNPGSAGEKRWERDYSFGILEVAGGLILKSEIVYF
jgi:uncharacterized protein